MGPRGGDWGREWYPRIPSAAYGLGQRSCGKLPHGRVREDFTETRRESAAQGKGMKNHSRIHSKVTQTIGASQSAGRDSAA